MLKYIITFLQIIRLVSSLPHHFRQENEICDWTDPGGNCDTAKGLSCNYDTNRCTCWDFRTTYSTHKSRCVGKANEQCVTAEHLCTENSHCVDDQSVSQLPICACKSGYFRNFNGTCSVKSKYGEFCQDFPEKRACSVENGLKCIQNKCSCAFGDEQTYDHTREMCISLVGGRCSKHLHNCQKHAECSEKMWELDYETGETRLSGYRCGCMPGLKVTESGHCAADYRGDCNTTEECYKGERLICLDGKCQCYPLTQVYSNEMRQCVNLVGTTVKCNVNSTNSSAVDVDKCTEFSECNNVTNTCQCLNGSSDTPYKTCLLNYGQPCQPHKCNVFDGLACLNGTCQCYDSRLVYDKALAACVSKDKEPCGKIKINMIGYEDVVDELYVNCLANSRCVETTYQGRIKHICAPIPKINNASISSNKTTRNLNF